MNKKTENEIKEMLYSKFVEHIDYIRESLIDIDNDHYTEDIISAIENNDDILETIFIDDLPFVYKECIKKYLE